MTEGARQRCKSMDNGAKERSKTRYKTDDKVQRNYKIIVKPLNIGLKQATSKPKVQKRYWRGRTKVKDKGKRYKGKHWS